MRLSKYHRDTFVKSVMSNVPFVDYERMMRVAILDWFTRNLPADVRKVYENDTLRGYIYERSKYIKEYDIYIEVPSDGTEVVFDPDVVLRDELNTCLRLRDQQRKDRDRLSLDLRNLIHVCHTIKQAYARVPPELHSHLPTDPAPPPDRTLPVVPPQLLLNKLASMGFKQS